LASTLVGGRVVLDVACGSGIGLDVLATGGPRLLVGCDLSGEAMHLSAGPAAQAAARLAQGDAVHLPFPDGAVDVVASFETLEHVADAAALVAELGRVLADDGTLLISTPNALVTKPVDGRPTNPWHVREFTPTELVAMLSPCFEHVEVLGQHPSAAYGRCLFWDPPTTAWERARLLLWKVGHRLPPAVRDGMTRVAGRRSYFPQEEDFAFTAEHVDRSHVVVARCTGPRR
jgi:SAM-dependent methyltransferase